MSVAMVLSKDDVQALATQMFDDQSGRWAMPDVLVDARPDFDGDEAIYIQAVFPDGVDRPDGPQQIDLQIDLGDRLMERGDFRLVYFSALSRSESVELKQLQNEDLPADA